jgi:hypothetical protein
VKRLHAAAVLICSSVKRIMTSMMLSVFFFSQYIVPAGTFIDAYQIFIFLFCADHERRQRIAYKAWADWNKLPGSLKKPLCFTPDESL